MEVSGDVLGLSIEALQRSGLYSHYKDILALVFDIEQAILNADSARLTGEYVTYSSRFLVPVPFSATTLTFVDTVAEELHSIRSDLAAIGHLSGSLSGTSTAVMLRALSAIVSSDILKLGPLLEKLGWLKTESVDRRISQSSLLLDALQQYYCKHESSFLFGRLLKRCRQAFVDSLLKELTYGAYIHPPVDSVLCRNYLTEEVGPEQLISISKSSLPAFLININVPLTCYINLLSLIVKQRRADSHLSRLCESGLSDSTIHEGSNNSSVAYSVIEASSKSTSFDTSLLDNVSVAEENQHESVSTDAIYHSDLLGSIHSLLHEIADTISRFREQELPALFHNSVWPLADVERVRELIVTINRRLGEMLNSERGNINSWLSLLFLRGSAGASFEHTTERLMRYTMETISIALPSTLSQECSAVDMVQKSGYGALLTESWFKIRVPLEFIAHVRRIMTSGPYPHKEVINKDPSQSTRASVLFEQFFYKRLKKIYKHVVRIAKNTELIQGDYLLLDLSNALPVLIFGVVHFHLNEESLVMGRAEYFLEERSQFLIEELAYLSRLTFMARIALCYAMINFAHLEKELGNLSFQSVYGMQSKDKRTEELLIQGLEEQMHRKDFLMVREIYSHRTCMSPLFPGVTRALNIMSIFVTSYSNYLRCMSFNLFEASGVPFTTKFGGLTALLRRAHMYGTISPSIKELLSNMLLLCVKTCYIVSLLLKLTSSFKSYEKLFTYVLHDCREVELQFINAWETLLQSLAIREQNQVLDASCATMITWLPELNTSAYKANDKLPVGASTSPAEAGSSKAGSDQVTSQAPETRQEVGIHLPRGTRDLSSLRLGTALGLRKQKRK